MCPGYTQTDRQTDQPYFLICYDNTLLSITFEPVVWFWCFNLGFKALDVYFSKKSSFYYLVGPLSLESAGKRTKLSKKSGLRYRTMLCQLKKLIVSWGQKELLLSTLAQINMSWVAFTFLYLATKRLQQNLLKKYHGQILVSSNHVYCRPNLHTNLHNIPLISIN